MDYQISKFSGRGDAGRQLAERLAAMGLDRPFVYALPRGGVPVAVEIARKLNAPLDLILVRKIGAPGNPELALGAIVEGTTAQIVINEDVKRMSGADVDYIERAYEEELAELDRRRHRYLGDRERLDPKGRTVVVVDDGMATGATMKAALIALKRNGAARIVVALPVAPKQSLKELEALVDDIICLHPATAFRGVGGFYHDFHQLTDEETLAMLHLRWDVQEQLAHPHLEAPPPQPLLTHAEEPEARRTIGMEARTVAIPPLGLIGDLVVPKDPRGIVLFAHGSGSSRLSPRNTYVASKLNDQGLATLLFDLLTPEEGGDRRNVFDIPLLAERVVEACMWVASEPDLADLPLGLFGASTGAAAALVAAAELKDRVAAVVSRGGRPDLAAEHLPNVSAPTLLIVGSLDHEVIVLNKRALAALTCEKTLTIVPGASHLFEEPGTLDLAIGHAESWFEAHFAAPTPQAVAPPFAHPNINVLRDAAEPLPDIDDPAFAEAFDRFGEHKAVLLGEASHGTAEFYRARAAITRRLIEEHGFSVVAVEADWPDAAAVDRAVRGMSGNKSVRAAGETERPRAFQRFPTWMWRNEEFAAFTGFLREHNNDKPAEQQVRFYGLDLYNMSASIAAVLGYLDRVDRAAARVARERYGCLSPWSREPAAYGRAALSHGFALCREPVIGILVDLLRKELDYTDRDGDRFFDAAQNARLVANAEQYYRAMYYGSHVSWNLRDGHMFETLKHILDRTGPNAKAVVWAHNSHIGDARSTDMGLTRGELNIGQLCREEYGDAAALIGFGTASGSVAAASEWDAPMEVKTIRPPCADSFEALCHAVGLERFLFDFHKDRDSLLNRVLAEPRLERYIGVIYRPESERASHYSPASLSEQFDGFVWFDHTGPVTPLETKPGKEGGDDETYPFGL